MGLAPILQMPPDHESSKSTTVQVECEMASLQEDSRPPDPLSRAIFVSHSEAQREFVERLCKDLQRAGLLPIFERFPAGSWNGEEFASHVSTAAEKFELVVVVVSEEYFTRSKWPMVELVALVETSGCKILPLFLSLSCEEFRDPKRRERWFQVWDSWGESDGGVCVDVWKDALRELDGRDGVEYVKAVGEVGYRKEIVATVCSRMQWSLQDEDIDVEKAISLGIQGLQRPGGGATRPKGWCYYFSLVLLTPIIIISIICVGSVLYSAFFCDQGYPSPYGIIFPMMI